MASSVRAFLIRTICHTGFMPDHEPADDPLGLQPVDREIRSEKLRREIQEVAGTEMFSGKVTDCNPEVEEAFLEQVLALETHGFVCPFDALTRDGFELPLPEKLDDDALTAKLCELIHALAARRLFLHSTNHLSDRELYSWLWSDGLREGLMGFGLPIGNCHLDVPGACTERTLFCKCAITRTRRNAPVSRPIFPTSPCRRARNRLTIAIAIYRSRRFRLAFPDAPSA